MTLDLPPLHDDLVFLSPLSEARAEPLVRWLARGLEHGGTLLDVGCGWGEMSLRVAAAAPLGRVIGIDLEEGRIAEACRRADTRGLGQRATYLVGDAASAGPAPVDALVAIGASQVWGDTEAVDQPLDYAAALTAMRTGVRTGARVLYAEAIWSRPPTPAATTPLSGRNDEFVTLSDLVDLAVKHGFAPFAVHEATLEEWDAFESGYCAGYARWLAAHEPDHADAAEVRNRAATQRTGYLRGYRGVLGMAYLQLLAV